jgi:hypothetical protein
VPALPLLLVLLLLTYALLLCSYCYCSVFKYIVCYCCYHSPAHHSYYMCHIDSCCRNHCCYHYCTLLLHLLLLVLCHSCSCYYCNCSCYCYCCCCYCHCCCSALQGQSCSCAHTHASASITRRKYLHVPAAAPAPQLAPLCIAHCSKLSFGHQCWLCHMWLGSCAPRLCSHCATSSCPVEPASCSMLVSVTVSHTPMPALCKCLSIARLLPPATSGMSAAVSVCPRASSHCSSSMLPATAAAAQVRGPGR